MGNKIRASGNLIEMGAMVSNLMPFVDKERFPRFMPVLKKSLIGVKRKPKKQEQKRSEET